MTNFSGVYSKGNFANDVYNHLEKLKIKFDQRYAHFASSRHIYSQGERWDCFVSQAGYRSLHLSPSEYISTITQI